MSSELHQLLCELLRNPACGFSVGGFGAIAEFQDEDVALHECSAHALIASSPRGALRVALDQDVTILAHEALSAHSDGWHTGLSVIGPLPRSARQARKTLSELGADVDALDPAERDAVLFDLGAGLPNIDYCVRTRDPALLELLRAHAGRAVIVAGHPLMEAVIEASPHRVVVSTLARIEVYQAIDRHHTPCGPHTHLLPDLLSSGRTHSANIPIPDQFLPLLDVHPENPLLDERGRRRTFARPAYDAFEALLEQFGDRDYVAEKRRFRAAVAARVAPQDYTPAHSRVARLAQRIALRQLAHLNHAGIELTSWQERFKQ